MKTYYETLEDLREDCNPYEDFRKADLMEDLDYYIGNGACPDHIVDIDYGTVEDLPF